MKPPDLEARHWYSPSDDEWLIAGKPTASMHAWVLSHPDAIDVTNARLVFEDKQSGLISDGGGDVYESVFDRAERNHDEDDQ